MAAPQGNQNAVGNSGGKSLNDRKLAAEVRSLALGEIKEILLGDDNEYKRQVILKLAPTILPRLNEHTGEDGDPIKHEVTGFNYLTPNDPNNPTNPQTAPGLPETSGQNM
jgi:hypothetical protein